MDVLLKEWIKMYPVDYAMICGEIPMSKLEYRCIMIELKNREFNELIEMLEKQKDNLLPRRPECRFLND